MSNLAFTSKAWEEYCYWQMQDKKTLKRINLLLKINFKNFVKNYCIFSKNVVIFFGCRKMKNLLKERSKYKVLKAIAIVAYFVFLFSLLLTNINIIP